ncbi:MAG: 4-alpha-glucanotransferase [Nevskia sp.]|nr:4-alpha-glucanotransferase [Nevskia sp.]
MTDAALTELARLAGLSVQWQDYRGAVHAVSEDSLRGILAALDLPCGSPQQAAQSLASLQNELARNDLPPLLTATAGQAIDVTSAELVPGHVLRLTLESGARRDVVVEARGGHLYLPPLAEPGYHRLQTDRQSVVLAVAPQRAFGPADLGGRRIWGTAAQLYALRRPGDGGAGDFTALEALVRAAGRRGADAVAISPVHALFGADLNRYSPYAPSSRLFLNPMYADPASVLPGGALAGIVAALGLQDELGRLERLALVDWPAVARARMAILRVVFERLWPGFPDMGGSPLPGLAAEFAAFRKAGGAALEDHARFEALHAVQFAQGRWHWRDWPEGLRSARSRSVSAFAGHHLREVGFHVFLQWLAQRGLAAAQAAARGAGLSIGLVTDLAVGTDSGGSHAWSRPHDMLTGLSVGAPPDELGPEGQVWGLTTLSPRALRLQGFAPFLDTLRASLRHAGGVRIDHVLGLNRLWVVPEGATALDGSYLRYPLPDLLRLIALESVRHRAVVIGEDLGTVPAGFRDELGAAGVMGMRVLWFERDHGFFIEPARWSARNMATTSTHDLPPVAGWWRARDIGWRSRLGLQTEAQRAQAEAGRAGDRQALWNAFLHAGVAAGAEPAADEPAAVVDAAVRFVARTPEPLAVVPLEDLAGLDEQPNLPGTIDEHPNWRRRMPADAEALLAQPAVAARIAAIVKERGGPPGAQ